ncbi:MAG: DUF502 domain-containing protein [Methylobacteriaceae bacterium]|nr:DUF502 domain-containing protein [Methylobacteriaceae bacterium]
MTMHHDEQDGFLTHGKPGLGARLRAYFFTGIIIVGPLAATAYITWWFVDTVDGWIKPLVPVRFWPDSYLPFHLPGLGVIIAVFGLTLLGFLAANLAGRTLLRLGERILDRMPVVRSIYKSLKQVFETVFSQQGSSFRKVGLVEFPAKGMWSVVFISSPPAESVLTHLPKGQHISVFLPCTPNPTTGFFFYLPASDVIEVPMTPDQAAKLIMSAGLIQPEVQAQLANMAEAARRNGAPPLEPPRAAGRAG